MKVTELLADRKSVACWHVAPSPFGRAVGASTQECSGARCLLSGCLPGHGGKHRQLSVVRARNVPCLASLELTLVTQTCLRFTEVSREHTYPARSV